MGRTLTQWRERQRALLGNPSISMISDADLDQFTYAAVRKFSIDRPRETFSDYTGNGTSYSFALPGSWLSGSSILRGIEYPQGQRPPIFLDEAEIQLYPDTSAPTLIQLNFTTPSAGAILRVHFTLPWPVPDGTAGADLVADTDYEYVARLAASGSAVELAARAAANKKSSLPSADVAGIETEEDRWMRVSKRYLTDYQEHVGTEQGPAPASGFVDWDARAMSGGPFLLRRARR